MTRIGYSGRQFCTQSKFHTYVTCIRQYHRPRARMYYGRNTGVWTLFVHGRQTSMPACSPIGISLPCSTIQRYICLWKKYIKWDHHQIRDGGCDRDSQQQRHSAMWRTEYGVPGPSTFFNWMLIWAKSRDLIMLILLWYLINRVESKTLKAERPNKYKIQIEKSKIKLQKGP